jgi:antitoxin component YwqK of YwqJK toxin-antitoxin module
MAENLVVRKYDSSSYSRIETFYQDGIVIAKWRTDFYYDVDKKGKKINGKYKYVNIEPDGREATGYVNYQNDKVADKEVIIKYANDQPMWVLHYKDGIKQGDETWYWEDGSILQTGTYANDRFEGDVIYYEKGVVIARRSFKKGKLNGKRTEYYPNGNIKYYFTHKDDKFHGLAESFYEDGTIKSRTVWKDDKEGPTVMFDRKGNKKSEYKKYTGDPDPKNLNDDVVKYWQNGNKRREYRNVNGKIEGLLKEYSVNGDLMKEDNYHDGMKHGESKNYGFDYAYASKTFNKYLSVVSNYINDKLDGQYIEYYPNGQVKVTVSYKQGKEQGEYIEYYKTGKIAFRKYYHDGLLNGEEKGFYENGNNMYEVKNRKGKRNGVLKKYSENGKFLEGVKYTKGIVKNRTYEPSNDAPKGYKHRYIKKGRMIKEVMKDAADNYDGYIDYVLDADTGERKEGKMYNKQDELIFLLKYFSESAMFRGSRIEYFDSEGLLKKRIVYFIDGGPKYMETMSNSDGYRIIKTESLTGDKKINIIKRKISPRPKSGDRINKKKSDNVMELIAK